MVETGVATGEAAGLPVGAEEDTGDASEDDDVVGEVASGVPGPPLAWAEVACPC